MRHELTNNWITRCECRLWHPLPGSHRSNNQSRIRGRGQPSCSDVDKCSGIGRCGATLRLDVATLESERDRVIAFGASPAGHL